MSKPSIVWGEKGEVSHRQGARKQHDEERLQPYPLPSLQQTPSTYDLWLLWLPMSPRTREEIYSRR